MILKVLNYREGQQEGHRFEEWTYVDNIVSASAYFDEESRLPVVRCCFKDEDTVTIAVPHAAYLMSDTGKTVDRIYRADYIPGEDDPMYPTLQDAVDGALNR